MERRSFAVIAVAAGLAMGLFGTLLFFDHAIGVSFPLFILLSVGLVLFLARPAGQTIYWRNLWPLLPLIFLAVMVAVRDDELIMTINIIAVLTLGAVGLYYLAVARPLDTESVGGYTTALMETGFMLLPNALIEGAHAWSWLREKRHQRGGVLAAVIRGGIFALPIVLVFAVLLGSADAVFANYVNQAFEGVRRALGLEYLDDTIGHLLFTASLATVVTGSLGFGLIRRPEAEPMTTAVPETPETDDAEDQAVLADHKPKSKPGFKLSMVESGIIMGSVVALFGAFVAIQFAYFFGGERTIEVGNITYAQYARRGFFELVAVSVLTLGLSLILDHVSVRQGKRENMIFRVLALLIVGLTSIMLVSASQRMWLYEEAFGFTQLRVYTHVFMLWLAVLFGFYVLAVFRLRLNIFTLGLVLSTIGYVGTLNLMNVDRYIADRNIARYHDGQELDIAFLNILSADAVPAVIPLWQESKPDTVVNTWAGQWLARQLSLLDRQVKGDGQFAFSFNVSRVTAWAELDRLRRQLPQYDASIYWGQNGYSRSSIEAQPDYQSGWETAATAAPRGE
ncbi:MAG: DUF4173 domain-containing protein [Anaerolineaceae bacterium]|nr:DUF4173 domain-containing protein [Anaerolineaceae bacterium]